MGFIEILLIACAVYMVYLTFKMKQTGEIPTFFVNNKVKLENAKDKEGYIAFMFPRMLIFSFFVAAFAVLSILSNYFVFPGVVTLIIYIGYVALLIFYSIISVKAQNRFLFK